MWCQIAARARTKPPRTTSVEDQPRDSVWTVKHRRPHARVLMLMRDRYVRVSDPFRASGAGSGNSLQQIYNDCFCNLKLWNDWTFPLISALAATPSTGSSSSSSSSSTRNALTALALGLGGAYFLNSLGNRQSQVYGPMDQYLLSGTVNPSSAAFSAAQQAASLDGMLGTGSAMPAAIPIPSNPVALGAPMIGNSFKGWTKETKSDSTKNKTFLYMFLQIYKYVAYASGLIVF